MAVRASDQAGAGFEGTRAWLGRSRMGELVREFDWARTPLGALDAWPQSLKTAVAICLRSPFQMAIYWGPELTCIYNDAEREVLGALHPGALGLPARALLSSSWEVVGPQLLAVIERGEPTWAEDQPLIFDRRGRPEVSYFTYSYSPLLDDDGAVGGVLLVTQDTTPRVLSERRVNAVRELIARSLDAPTAAEACTLSAQALANAEDVPLVLLYIVEDDGKRASCAIARERTGATQARRPSLALDDCTDEVSALFADVAAGSGGELAPTRWFVGGTRGRWLPKQVFVSRLGAGPDGEVEGYLVAGVSEDRVFDDAYEDFLEMVAVAIGRSMTAARARETERQRASEIAAIDRAKTALFSNASHELRTPLALILGYLEQLLEDQAVPGAARDTVAIAHRGALRMLKLVNALLDFSRIEAGESIGSFQLADVARLTSEVANMFESTAARAGLRLVIDCPPLNEPMLVDCEAWERIVSNLISNALKFTPQGEIRVRTRVQRGSFCLTVEDTGIGIAPEDLEHIFSRFYRSEDPRARTHEGSGIGLALVRELVHVHGGSVKAQSRRDRGTRITVRVPLAGRRHAAASVRPPASFEPRRSVSLFLAEAEGWFGDDADARAQCGPRKAAAPALAPSSDSASDERPRVLVAEDNADMREYLRRLLEPHFSVALAADGARALELARRGPPRIVISDVMMPSLDGFGLIRELRQDPRTRDVPVILLSARADPESTLEALGLGADDYIIKPFGAPELLARIRATLENSRARLDLARAQGRVEERARHAGELKALLNDLRAAQRRVAAAGDAERRRIERDLHDGAQQRLMAIRLELGLLTELLLEKDSLAASARLKVLQHEVDEALEELRELGHGLYPPLLASDGLHAALLSVARRSPIPVTVEGSEVPRAPRSIENAAYFCCLEALQNVAKHAGPGARASVDLRASGGSLEFRVCDDGAGFDPDAVPPGHGLINLRDRLDALGGHLEVASARGSGTTVLGHIPLP